jgi:hypothetical protein
MKKLLLTAAVLMVATSGPGFAAPRTHHTQNNSTVQRPVATTDSADSPYNAYARANGQYGYSAGQNLPYPDRPWGDPDRD